MDTFLQDVRYGFRMLRKAPGLSGAAVIALALGIGANIVIFSFVDAFCFRPLPVRDPDRLVVIYTSCPMPSGIYPRCAGSNLDMIDVKAQAKSLADVAVFQRRGALLMENGDAKMLLVNLVSDNWLEMMGLVPAAGRAFTAAEQASPDTPPEAMLSYSFWQGRFGGDRSIIGRALTLTGQRWTIVGVMPRGYRGTDPLFDPELTIPMSSWRRASSSNRPDNREERTYHAYGRLRPGASVADLNTELRTISRRLEQAYPESNRQRFFTAMSEMDSRMQSRRTLAATLFAISGLVLLIACANVVNLLFARGEHRRREIATRLVLGATRARIARQCLVENALLALIAGALALLVGAWTMRFLPSLLSGVPIPVSLDVRLDARVLEFAMAAAFCSVFVFGLAPALDASRTTVLASLAQRASSGERKRAWLRDGLVVAQIWISLTLMVGTGLLLRSLLKMEAADPGFAAHRPMLVADVVAPLSAGVRRSQQFRLMQEELAALPGIRSVAFANRIPMSPSGGGLANEVFVPGQLQANGRGISVKSAYVSRGYFETIGTALLRGRVLETRDEAPNVRAAVINQTMATRFWPGEDALGQLFKIGREGQTREEFEVVGIVQDGKYNNLVEEAEPYLFLSTSRFRGDMASVVLATEGDPAALAAPVRQRLRDKLGFVVLQVVTMREFMRTASFVNRLTTQLVTAIAILGMLLATIGLYAVMSFLVGRRSHEIGVRMALGASQQSVLRLFLLRGAATAGIGVALGLVSAMALGSVAGSLLYGVSPRDPLTFVGAAGILLLAAFAASCLPARRASKVDPMVVLRCQ